LGVEPKEIDGDEIGLNIQPNPASDFVVVDFGAKKIKSIELISIEGKSLGFFYPENNKQSVRLPMSHLSSGIYFVKALLPSGKLVSARFIKN
jgi:hypothetical protein